MCVNALNREPFHYIIISEYFIIMNCKAAMWLQDNVIQKCVVIHWFCNTL